MNTKKDTKEILEQVRKAKNRNKLKDTKIAGKKKDKERFRKMNFNG